MTEEDAKQFATAIGSKLLDVRDLAGDEVQGAADVGIILQHTLYAVIWSMYKDFPKSQFFMGELFRRVANMFAQQGADA